jgi:hypothetical protein
VTSTRRHLRTAVTIVAALLISLLGPAPARADNAVQRSIDAQLAAYPGGKQINATEVAYANGAFIITFARPVGVSATSSDCPSGWFCFYDHVSFGYPRGRLSDCGWQDLAWWGWQNRTESVAYNLSVGSTVFLGHGGTDHSGDYRVFEVGTANRAIADVAPSRNDADHVYRICF